tara:strand:+ start:507 stop:869 length:363 start_codon:yes stop_codon:yes gene_type:complete
MIEYTVKVFENGDKQWYLNGNFHREDGPAVECANGTKKWYLDGKLHREDGPAIERADGSKHWYLNNNLHRDDGPAIERASGTKEWFLNNKEVTKQEVMKSSCVGKIVNIDGKKYKLEEVS